MKNAACYRTKCIIHLTQASSNQSFFSHYFSNFLVNEQKKFFLLKYLFPWSPHTFTQTLSHFFQFSLLCFFLRFTFDFHLTSILLQFLLQKILFVFYIFFISCFQKCFTSSQPFIVIFSFFLWLCSWNFFHVKFQISKIYSFYCNFAGWWPKKHQSHHLNYKSILRHHAIVFTKKTFRMPFKFKFINTWAMREKDKKKSMNCSAINECVFSEKRRKKVLKHKTKAKKAIEKNGIEK